MSRAFSTLAPLALLLAGCYPWPHDTGSDTSDTPPGDTSTEDSGDEVPPGVHATITGNIEVEVYTYDSDGEMVEVDETDTYGESFPYGFIFAAAYYEDADGDKVYLNETSITDPEFESNPYSLTVDTEETEEVYVYAALDYWGERIISTGDPVGIHAEPITTKDGSTLEDIDITILASLMENDTGGGGEGGNGGYGGCTRVEVSGSVIITLSYSGGEVGVMFLNTDDEGPLWNSVQWYEPEADSDGADQVYSIDACANTGEVNLVAGWDSNGTYLLDPADQWGSYATYDEEEETYTDANPLDIGSEDLPDTNIVIPLGDDSPLSLVPFVSLSGEITMEGETTFADLPEGTDLYVAALKYRPDAEISDDDLVEAYDYEKWSWEDFKDAEAIDYKLSSPTNTFVYLWAYADTDADGELNEHAEPVGSGGSNEQGRVTVTETSQSDLHIALMSNE